MNTKQLRQKILDLAIHGKLVPQDPTEGSAEDLLREIGKARGKKIEVIVDNVPFEVPDGWSWCRLGEILTNRDSERIPLSLSVRSKQQEKKYDYYGATGVVDKVDGYIFDERLLLIGEDGANLLSRSKNNAFFAEGKYWVNNHAHVLDCSIKKVLDYAAFIINSMSLEKYVTGSAQPKLNQDNLSKILIPLPPLAEQKRIVERVELLLKEVEAIEKAEGDIKQIANILRSKVLDLAIRGKLTGSDTKDWKWVKGEKLFFNMETKKPSGTLFKYIDIDSIDNRNCKIKEVRIVPTANAPSRASRKTSKGDTLFSMVRPYLKNIAMVEEDDCIASTGFFVCHTSDDVDNKFCYYLMTSRYVVDGLNFFMKGDNSPSIRKSDIENFSFPLPPLSEQKRIVEKIEQLFAEIDVLTR